MAFQVVVLPQLHQTSASCSTDIEVPPSIPKCAMTLADVHLKTLQTSQTELVSKVLCAIYKT